MLKQIITSLANTTLTYFEASSTATAQRAVIKPGVVTCADKAHHFNA